MKSWLMKWESTTERHRNVLYKTIIGSIIWHRIGDNIDVKINFL